jgi:ATP-dependent exoDNAse (exonuclease V) alpha subunit
LIRIQWNVHGIKKKEFRMKIMFITNDRSSKPQHWVNGTIGYVKEIHAIMNDVSSVTIDIQGKAIEVCREDMREYELIDGITQIVGTINKIFYLCISGSFGNDFL